MEWSSETSEVFVPVSSLEFSNASESLNIPNTWEELNSALGKMIRCRANRYSNENFYALNQDNLEAEGLLVYSELIVSDSNLPPNIFWLKLHKSLSNHFKQLIQFHLYTDKRQLPDNVDGISAFIDLSGISELLGTNSEEITYNEYIEAVGDLIKNDPELIELFSVMIDPPKEVEDLVWTEQLLKREQACGQKNIRYLDSQVMPRNIHFREYLGWSAKKFSKHLSELQAKTLTVIC